jgi:5'-nucleotidase
MTKKRLIFDQDDVLADTNGKLVEMVLNEFGIDLPRTAFVHQTFQELLPPADHKRLYEAIHAPGFFADIPVKENAVEVVSELSEKYEIFVATAAMEFPNSFREKYDWLQHYFPFIHWSNIVFCGDKSILQGDYLIDDMARNFANFGGEAVLFSMPHNRTETVYGRVANWNDIAAKFL